MAGWISSCFFPDTALTIQSDLQWQKLSLCPLLDELITQIQLGYHSIFKYKILGMKVPSNSLYIIEIWEWSLNTHNNIINNTMSSYFIFLIIMYFEYCVYPGDITRFLRSCLLSIWFGCQVLGYGMPLNSLARCIALLKVVKGVPECKHCCAQYRTTEMDSVHQWMEMAKQISIKYVFSDNGNCITRCMYVFINTEMNILLLSFNSTHVWWIWQA